MANRFNYIPNRVIDTNGISDGASLFFYAPGTTTKIDIYSDSTLATPLANPVVVAAGSAVPVVYYSETSVRVKVVNAAGATVSDDDPYAPVDAATVPAALDDPDAITETLLDDYQRTVSVAKFGVVGDGTNETAKIQKAVTYACNNDLVLIWPQPSTEYVFSSLTFPAGKNVVWRGQGRKRVKIKGLTTDATIGSPTGDVVDIEGFRFQDFLSGFTMDGIATGAELRFEDLYLKNCGRIRNIAAARTDFRAFITCTVSANKIESLHLRRVYADQGDFIVCYRGPFKSASVEHCNATNMERSPIWIGWNAAGVGAYDREFAEVKHCRFTNTISANSAEYEIHGIFVNAAVFDISHNYIDTVTDIHASIHDSEAIYVKGPVGRIAFNTVIDGGRGDGCITSKSFNYSGGPMDATDSRYGRHIHVHDNIVQRRAAYTSLYGSNPAAYFLKGGALSVRDNHAYGSFSSFYTIFGSGDVVGNTGDGSTSYGIRAFPSYLESGLGVLTTRNLRIEGNDFAISGTVSSVVHVRLDYTSGGQILDNLIVRNNRARIATGATWAGESAMWSVRVDRVASGTSNEIRNAVLEDNKAYGVAGSLPASCYRFDTAQGSAGVVGKVTQVRIKGGESNYTQNIVTHSWGSSGDCARMEIIDEYHTNVSNEIFSGTPSNVTTLRVRNISGTYRSELRGNLSFAAADTSKTLSTSMRPSMFPSTLAASNLTLTIVSAAGSTKTLSATAINTGTREFTVTADAAPGAAMTVSWELRNPYYYN